MKTRQYLAGDYEEVKALLIKHDQGRTFPSQKELGGYALVAEHDGKIVAFAWALVAEDSTIALVEYFVVEKDCRNMGAGGIIMTHLLINLNKLGKKHIVGIVKKDTPHADALARIYHEMGMDTATAWIMTGSAGNILEHLQKRETA